MHPPRCIKYDYDRVQTRGVLDFGAPRIRLRSAAMDPDPDRSVSDGARKPPHDPSS